MFQNSDAYKRHLTFTSNGVSVTETSADLNLTRIIRAHAAEVSGFVSEGMPAFAKNQSP